MLESKFLSHFKTQGRHAPLREWGCFFILFHLFVRSVPLVHGGSGIHKNVLGSFKRNWGSIDLVPLKLMR